MDRAWITPDNFDPNKLSLQYAASKSPGDIYERGKLMYEYVEGVSKRELVVTVPRTPEAYITCRGVQKDTFARGETRIETNRYGAQLVIDGSNQYHVALYQLFEKVISRIKDLTNTNVIFPAKDMPNYTIIYTNIIHSNDGTMYTKAYTDKEYLEVTECGKCIVRPAILLSTLKKSTAETKIRVQISQMYVHESVNEFSLATED